MLSFIDQKQYLQELAPNFRKDLIKWCYSSLFSKIPLLHQDELFTATLFPSLKIIRVNAKEMIYREEDPAVECKFKLN